MLKETMLDLVLEELPNQIKEFRVFFELHFVYFLQLLPRFVHARRKVNVAEGHLRVLWPNREGWQKRFDILVLHRNLLSSTIVLRR